MTLPDRSDIASHDRSEADDERLAEYLHRQRHRRGDLVAFHLRLSAFPMADCSPESLRLLARPFASLQSSGGGSIFRLANRDVMLVFRRVPADAMTLAITKAHALFADTAVASPGDGRFAVRYDLARDDAYQALVDFADRRAAKVAAAPIVGCGPPKLSAVTGGGRSLQPADLASIRARLERMSLARCVRQQTALELHASGTARPILRETYVSMQALQARLDVEIDASKSASLFRYLTELLDHGMMTLVAQGRVPRTSVPISLNLNVRSVTAREFQGFHVSLGDAAATTLIEIHLVDILADTRAFAYARDLLRDLGYRVLIDGVSPLMPRHLNLEPLAPDLVKVWWSPAVMPVIADGHEQRLRELVAARGPDNVILARTDSEQAVHWALPLGIRRFQGFFVDRLASALQPTRAA